MSDVLRFACAIPVGGWHPFLPAALESLAEQSVPLEVALLDASGDDRVAMAADTAGVNFTYRRSGPDAGQAAAIAEGWRETGGEIVFWLNADDRLLPGVLSQVAAAFQASEPPDVVFGGSQFINARGDVTGRHEQVADATDLLLRSNTISQPSCFVRRKAVDQVGGLNESLHYVMDWDLWVRLYRAGATFVQVNEALSAVYMGQDTKTGGLAPRRLFEVCALVNRNAGPWAALKSTVSLAGNTLHHRWGAP